MNILRSWPGSCQTFSPIKVGIKEFILNCYSLKFFIQSSSTSSFIFSTLRKVQIIFITERRDKQIEQEGENCQSFFSLSQPWKRPVEEVLVEDDRVDRSRIGNHQAGVYKQICHSFLYIPLSSSFFFSGLDILFPLFSCVYLLYSQLSLFFLATINFFLLSSSALEFLLLWFNFQLIFFCYLFFFPLFFFLDVENSMMKPAKRWKQRIFFSNWIS